MKKYLILICGVLCGSVNASPAYEQALPELTRHVLWNKAPAKSWNAGFPIGNGSLGSMIQGYLNEEFIINEDTLWESSKPRDLKGAHENLDEVKRLIAEGKFHEAEAIVGEKMLTIRNSLANRPMCKLKLSMHDDEKADEYRHMLDMQHGIGKLVYEKGGVVYTREHFVSHPDQVWMMKLGSNSSLSFDLDFNGFTDLEFKSGKKALYVSGETEPGGTEFALALRVQVEGGSSAYNEKGLSVKDAKSAVVMLTVGTDYYGEDPMKLCKKRMSAVVKKKYSELKAAHVADHSALYDRVDVQLGDSSDPAAKSTAERIASAGKGVSDTLLDAQFYQMGRYVIIASSRPGAMPAHLQGIWVSDFAPRYHCAYHININVEMNYWPAEVGNLSELHLPLFDFLDRLRENGRKTAREHYDCDGFVLHHNIDGSLVTGPHGKPAWGFWPMGHTWLCQHIWEHYLFTQNEGFLRSKGYPIMKEAAEFVLDYLMENPDTGQLIVGPSTSPENFYMIDGEKAHVMTGIAGDQQLAWDLFESCVHASEVLGISDGFIERVHAALARLEMPQIGDDGRILEWRVPQEEGDRAHRHYMNIHGVYPGAFFTPENNKKWYEAARKSLEARIEAQSQPSKGKDSWRGPAWSKAYAMIFFARFFEAENAYASYMRLFEKEHIREGLFASFSATRVIMDANTGAASGIAEMLMQSHRGFIDFIPALPEVWREGSFSGLKARGAFVVDLDWKDGKWREAVVKSEKGGVFKLKTDAKVSVYEDGKAIKFTQEKGFLEFETKPSGVYVLR